MNGLKDLHEVMRGEELTGCDAPNIAGLDPAPNGEDACTVGKTSAECSRPSSRMISGPPNEPVCCVLITCC